MPQVRVVRCAAKTHPCPTCGQLGRRKRSLHRRMCSLAYRQVASLDVHDAEYQSRCGCCKFFRSWPPDVPPRPTTMTLPEAGKFKKAVAFVSSAAGQQVRTNNHVERANRRLRFWEKLRYKWRNRKWVLRFVLLALDRCWCAAAEAAAQAEQAAAAEPREQSPPFKAAG